MMKIDIKNKKILLFYYNYILPLFAALLANASCDRTIIYNIYNEYNKIDILY